MSRSIELKNLDSTPEFQSFSLLVEKLNEKLELFEAISDQLLALSTQADEAETELRSIGQKIYETRDKLWESLKVRGIVPEPNNGFIWELQEQADGSVLACETKIETSQGFSHALQQLQEQFAKERTKKARALGVLNKVWRKK